MMELTQEQIERRAETVISGTYKPEIPGLDIVFHRMGLAEKGISSRAYSSKLKELYDVGGYFSEFAVPTVLRKVCKENGLDAGAIAKKRALMERMYKSIPEEFAGPYDQLTDEEVAELSPEAHAARASGMADRGRRMTEWMFGFYSDDDHALLAEAEQVERIEAHIRANTAEHFARKHQMETEIVQCARREDGAAAFASIDAVQNLPSAVLTQLYLKWKQFREGLTENFFSPS